jgi:hypothetical protein
VNVRWALVTGLEVDRSARRRAAADCGWCRVAAGGEVPVAARTTVSVRVVEGRFVPFIHCWARNSAPDCCGMDWLSQSPHRQLARAGYVRIGIVAHVARLQRELVGRGKALAGIQPVHVTSRFVPAYASGWAVGSVAS